MKKNKNSEGGSTNRSSSPENKNTPEDALEELSSEEYDDELLSLVEEDNWEGLTYKDTMSANPELKATGKQWAQNDSSHLKDFKMKRAEMLEERLSVDQVETFEEEWIPTKDTFGSNFSQEQKVETDDGEVLQILPGGSYIIAGKEDNMKKLFLKSLTVGVAISIPFIFALTVLLLVLQPKL